MWGFWESTQLLNNNRTYLQQGIYFGFCRRACILHIYSILPFLRAKVHCVGFYMTFESIQRSAKRLLSSLWFLSEYQTSTCFELSASLIGFFFMHFCVSRTTLEKATIPLEWKNCCDISACFAAIWIHAVYFACLLLRLASAATSVRRSSFFDGLTAAALQYHIVDKWYFVHNTFHLLYNV